jgi:hypothetical protein
MDETFSGGDDGDGGDGDVSVDGGGSEGTGDDGDGGDDGGEVSLPVVNVTVSRRGLGWCLLLVLLLVVCGGLFFCYCKECK